MKVEMLGVLYFDSDGIVGQDPRVCAPALQC